MPKSIKRNIVFRRKTAKYTKSSLVKLKITDVIQKTKSNYIENAGIFLKKNISRLKKKKFLVRFEPTNFAVPGVFFTSRLRGTNDLSDSVKQVVSTKKSIFRFDKACWPEQ